MSRLRLRAWLLCSVPTLAVDPASSVLQAADWIIFLSCPGSRFDRLPDLEPHSPLVRGALLLFVVPAAGSRSVYFAALHAHVLNTQGTRRLCPAWQQHESSGMWGREYPSNYVVAAPDGRRVPSSYPPPWVSGGWGRTWLICAGHLLPVIWGCPVHHDVHQSVAGSVHWESGRGWDTGSPSRTWREGQPAVVLLFRRPCPSTSFCRSCSESRPSSTSFRRQDMTGPGPGPLGSAVARGLHQRLRRKMPWLLVNITTPFILLAAKYLGELAIRARTGRSILAATAAERIFHVRNCRGVGHPLTRWSPSRRSTSSCSSLTLLSVLRP